MDLQKTKDGKPYGPIRYKEIVHERYFITKNTNITYSDTGQLTPVEREYIIKYISDEIEKMKEMTEQAKQNK